MSNRTVGLRLPEEANEKLEELAHASWRTKGALLAILIMAAEAHPDGSITVHLPEPIPVRARKRA